MTRYPVTRYPVTWQVGSAVRPVTDCLLRFGIGIWVALEAPQPRANPKVQTPKVQVEREKMAMAVTNRVGVWLSFPIRKLQPS